MSRDPMSRNQQSNVPTSFNLPYDFVPLSAFVYQPEWAKEISHDHPFADGVSGSFAITITAKTPILCAAGDEMGGNDIKDEGKDQSKDKPKDKTFFKTPDGCYAIPGSSLRGMIRNTIEIAAFGRMAFIDKERRFGIREISGTDEINKTAQEIYIDRLDKPKTGFLIIKDNIWSIIPCSCAYLPITEIHKIIYNKPILVKNPILVKRENIELRYNSLLKFHTINAKFKIKDRGNYHDKFSTVEEIRMVCLMGVKVLSC